MGLIDDAKGKTKETTGKARGDKSQEYEGKGDQIKGDLKDAADKASDTVKDAVNRDDK